MKIYVTFGQQYRHEKHPVDSRAHPDGWFEYDLPKQIINDLAVWNCNTADCFVIEKLNHYYSNWYSESTFNKSYYPRGKLNGPEVNGLYLYEDYFKL